MNTIANEVEIVIRASDRSGPGLAAARAKTTAFARETQETLRKTGRDGGKDLGDGINKGLREGTERGRKTVEGFVSSITRSVTSIDPLVRAAIAGGVVAAAPAAGAAASAVVGAVGSVLTGIGVAAAAQSQRVRTTFSALGRDLRAELMDIARPLELSLIRTADVARSTFTRLRPALASFFQNVAPSVDTFIRRLGDGIASLGESFGPLQQGFSAVLASISGRFPQIFGSLERAFETLGRTAEKNAEDIAAVFEFAADAIEGTATVLERLADEWDAFTSRVETTGSVLEDVGRGIGRFVSDFWRSIGVSTEALDEFDARMRDTAGGVREAAEAAIRAAGDFRALSGSLAETVLNADDLEDEMQALSGVHLDADEAASEYQEALDRLTKSIRENGKGISLTTEKGRENRAALRDIARAAQAHIAAMVREGQSLGAVSRTYRTYRSQLISAARQAGLTAREARELAAAWLAVPRSVHTTVTVTRRDIHLSAQREQTFGFGMSRNAAGGIIGGIGAGVRGMQTGGISGSATALVGEQGPELVRLPVGSTVTPAGQTRSMLGGFGSISMAFRPGGGGGGDLGRLSNSIEKLVKTLRDVITLREGMRRFTDLVMGQAHAFISYEAALDRAAAALKKNGKTLNINKEKGRENRSALLDLAQAAHEATFAMADLGRPISAIVDRMKEQRAEFIKMARAMGLTKKEAQALADKWGLIPSQVKKILTKQAKDVAFNRAAEAFNTALESRSGRASGGPAGGWTLTGERGPELVRLPFGSSVVPAGQSAAMMTAASAAGGGRVVLEIRSGGSRLDDLLVEVLRKAVRDRGGNVQLALGGR